ncbi:MAG TPA: hypothetical protein ENI48_02670 [Thioploca sp.]|nr:hypothetical protein [Thioploca sp.]
MKIGLDLKYQSLKKMMTVADITGNVNVSFMGDFLGKGIAKQKLINLLIEKDLSGTITIDGEKIDLDKYKANK